MIGGYPQCFVIVFLRNVVDILASGKTAYFQKFGIDYNGPVIPCGAEIEYKPNRKLDIDRLHAMGRQTLSGIFLAITNTREAGGARI